MIVSLFMGKAKDKPRSDFYLPPLTTLKPKSRITRQRSQPRPVLSGQLMVITLGSPGRSGCRMSTTSSLGRPISFSLTLPALLELFPFSSLLYLSSNKSASCFPLSTSVSGGKRGFKRTEERRAFPNPVPVLPIVPEFQLKKERETWIKKERETWMGGTEGDERRRRIPRATFCSLALVLEQLDVSNC